MIHSTAIIESDSIGEGTRCWAWSHICNGAVIGKNCVIGEGVYIGPNVVIGENCKVQNHSLIYEGLRIGSNVFIGPNVITTNDIMPKADGKAWVSRFRFTEIHDRASIGANSVILCGISIGEGSMIGCGSVVVRNVKPWWLVCGNPASHRRPLDKWI